MQWLACKTEDFSREDYARAYENLTPSRKEHIDRFRKAEDRRRSLAGELLAQRLLREKFNVTDAVLYRSENGQPALCGCDLFVSIAHCGDMAVCAVSEEPVGIDIERIRPMDLAAARHVCVAEELQYLLEGNPIPEKGTLCEDAVLLRRFYEIWTAKEAYFKKQGTGITNLRSVNILPIKRQIFTLEDYLIQII